MELKNKFISIKMENGLFTSIKYKEQEILHDGKKDWFKQFPIIFPVTGISTGFEFESINYEIPKHGFWNNINFSQIFENNKIVLLGTVLKDKNFPFNIDIQQEVWLENNDLIISTNFTNISKTQKSYYQFGYHPAFKIDKNAHFDQGLKGNIINQENKMGSEIHFQKISDIHFGSIDTIWTSYSKINLIANGLNLEFTHNLDNLQIWKKPESEFICIEPWQGYDDRLNGSKAKVEEKINIVKLKPLETKNHWLKIRISKVWIIY